MGPDKIASRRVACRSLYVQLWQVDPALPAHEHPAYSTRFMFQQQPNMLMMLCCFTFAWWPLVVPAAYRAWLRLHCTRPFLRVSRC